MERDACHRGSGDQDSRHRKKPKHRERKHKSVLLAFRRFSLYRYPSDMLAPPSLNILVFASYSSELYLSVFSRRLYFSCRLYLSCRPTGSVSFLHRQRVHCTRRCGCGVPPKVLITGKVPPYFCCFFSAASQLQSTLVIHLSLRLENVRRNEAEDGGFVAAVSSYERGLFCPATSF